MSKPVPGLQPVSEEDGNLGDISKAGSLHEFLTDLHNEYGPIASFWWGKMYTISIASAELFEEQQHLFDRHPGPFKAQFQALLEPKCIQYANKEDGLNRRRHYSQGLTKEAVRKHIPQLQEVADELVGKWGKMLEDPKIPLGQYTSLIALKILLHTLFGNLMKDDQEELKFRSETDEVFQEMELGLVKRRTTERAKHMDEEKQDLKKLVLQMIRDRKMNPSTPGDEVLLDYIISYSDDEGIQEADALEFSTAGQFALEYFLTSVVYYVATHPEVDEKLQDEFKVVLGDKNVDVTNIDQLVYTKQVMDETLRCSLNCTWGCRYYDVDSKLAGYDIPKNTPIIHALGVAMMNEEIWPEPDKFNPDRFSKENCEARSNFWFSTFGVGRRKCIAKEFPLVAATVVLVNLLRKFKIQLSDPQQQMITALGLISHSKEEIFVSLSQR